MTRLLANSWSLQKQQFREAIRVQPDPDVRSDPPEEPTAVFWLVMLLLIDIFIVVML